MVRFFSDFNKFEEQFKNNDSFGFGDLLTLNYYIKVIHGLGLEFKKLSESKTGNHLHVNSNYIFVYSFRENFGLDKDVIWNKDYNLALEEKRQESDKERNEEAYNRWKANQARKEEHDRKKQEEGKILKDLSNRYLVLQEKCVINNNLCDDSMNVENAVKNEINLVKKIKSKNKYVNIKEKRRDLKFNFFDVCEDLIKANAESVYSFTTNKCETPVVNKSKIMSHFSTQSLSTQSADGKSIQQPGDLKEKLSIVKSEMVGVVIRLNNKFGKNAVAKIVEMTEVLIKQEDMMNIIRMLFMRFVRLFSSDFDKFLN